MWLPPDPVEVSGIQTDPTTLALHSVEVMLRAGVDLGGTKIQAVVIDDGCEVLGSALRPTPRSGGPRAVATELLVALREAAAAAGAKVAELAGVGVGAPGTVDAAAGTVAHADNVPGWDAAFPLAGTLSGELGLPVSLVNDVQAAVNAEFAYGAGAPFSSVLGVFWGTGVGGGLVLDGKPWVGRGAAGELGHMVVVKDGDACPCGRRGCVEAYAGRTPLEAQARLAVERGERTRLFELMQTAGRSGLSSDVWARAVEQRDADAVRLIDRALDAIGAGVASAVNLLDVEAVVVGGGFITHLGPRYVEKLARAMQDRLYVPERPPAVCPSALGELSGAIGAGLLVT